MSDQAPAPLRTWLLGELELRHGEVPLAPLGSARAESLLAYLLLHREAAQPASGWPSCSGPTPASPRPGPTCATCSTSCAGPCPTPTGSWR